MAFIEDQPIIGKSYTYDASGGYSLQQTFPEIPVSEDFFLANALQIRLGVDTFNRRIGITKDASNINVLEINYDKENDRYLTDELDIKASELIQLVGVDNIISMGSLSSLYSDFNYTVLEYFGAPYGFSSFFSGEEHYNINGGVFDASALIHIINGNTFNFAGSYVSDLSGSITVHKLTNKIKKACTNNSFRNRPVEKKLTFKDGFIAGDLIYITEGISITLTVDIEAEPYTPIYNIGPSNLAKVDRLYNSLNYINRLTFVKKQTTSSLINIKQVYTVPILILLSNITDTHFISYGNNWVDVTSATLDNMNWLSCAVSASGKFQTAVEEFGSIYTSSDYGVTWKNAYDIGNAMTNCISMSHSGEYQTACNGEKIYISSDHGNTWTETQTVNNTDIFVCISLSGKYQLVISQGDALYRSVNYGLSWIRYYDENSDIYNSILSFPSAGASMSFDGRYQTIVCENIYRSSDYGVTWSTTNVITDANGYWDDHNWYGVDMSSDGQYQAAIEVIGEIYTSNDYGMHWSKIDLPIVTDIMWQAISISASGQCMTAVAKNGSIYYSIDYGVSLEKNPDPNLSNKDWSCVSVSSNALYQLAGVYGGGLYTSRLD
jgi:photosystem II stability/assembly factor-like uncharacterized protein